MGFMDSVKGLFGGKKDATGTDTVAELKDVATKVDDQAQKLAASDGAVGDVAEKTHEVLDKVDGD